MYRLLSDSADLVVYGAARSEWILQHIPQSISKGIIVGTNVESNDSLIRLFATVRPDCVINCIGLVKQLADANDPLQALPVNTLLPHRLADLCRATRSRLIHISTDCVFSGEKGSYLETDFPDANDLYGRSKLLGEVDYPHAITLRTSIIGHELLGSKSLVNWFLAQKAVVKGFSRAIFSGLPTVELATVIRDFVLPNKDLHGLYHVASQPINKFDLLNLIAKVYGKDIEIISSEDLVIDRSLNADRFNEATHYRSPDWFTLIKKMHDFEQKEGSKSVYK
jgi:dTDP-4-dehydrorhamnose reductase